MDKKHLEKRIYQLHMSGKHSYIYRCPECRIGLFEECDRCHCCGAEFDEEENDEIHMQNNGASESL